LPKQRKRDRDREALRLAGGHSAREDIKRLLHEGCVILEDASVSGILVEDEFGSRRARSIELLLGKG
jgi:hypothetical protein